MTKNNFNNSQNIIKNQLNKDLTNNLKNIKSPEENFEFVTKRMDNQTELLQNLQYENMKLNSQIEVMNKTIDFNNEELKNLRNINTELKDSNKILKENNQILKDSNKHYWRNTFVIAFVVAFIFFLLGLAFPT